NNNNGQLGNGTSGNNTGTDVPGPVSGIASASEVSVAQSGGESACALIASGSVDCWGNNGAGELGDGGTEADSPVPVAVSGITKATQVVAGVAESCALLANGSIDCWGWNTYGQLGDGNSGGPSDVPVAVRGITNAIQVVLGNTHACALLADKSVECWGDNS